MAVKKTILGRVPTLAGEWDADYVNPKTGHSGYPLKKRCLRYGSEFQSLLEDNTYPPATLNEAGTQITFDTVHWMIISNGTDAYLFKNVTEQTLAQIETEQEQQRIILEGKQDKLTFATDEECESAANELT